MLTDVPYGMDREFVLEDCRPIIDHIDVLLTSVDVGYRKPHVEGYMKLSALLGVSPSERLNGQEVQVDSESWRVDIQYGNLID